jgi:hypothetical protein
MSARRLLRWQRRYMSRPLSCLRMQDGQRGRATLRTGWKLFRYAAVVFDRSEVGALVKQRYAIASG